MAITLVINLGSSSKKFALYKEDIRKINAYVESSKESYNLCSIVGGIQQRSSPVSKARFRDVVGEFLLLAQEQKIVKNFSEIKTVAIRVVAPGTFFQTHRELDLEYVKKLRAMEAVAPLHIPNLLKEIEVIKKKLPHARLIGVSDSAFHKTIPDFIREYSLPKPETDKFDIHRFGYHGLSVSSAMSRVHAVTGVDPKRAIVCHIGSGVSVTAIKDGESLDTSMGYAPGTGLIMRSRAGDLDTGALLALMKFKNLKPIDAETYIQTSGGLQGIASEMDLRQLLERKVCGDDVAEKAIASFVYQIQKNIGGYMAILGGLDMLIFTATAAERSPILRSLVIEKLSEWGLNLDSEKNELCVSKDGVISTQGSKTKIVVIKTDEEGEMLKISKTIK